MIPGKTTCLFEFTADVDTTGVQEDGYVLPNVGRSPFDGYEFVEIIASLERFVNFQIRNLDVYDPKVS